MDFANFKKASTTNCPLFPTMSKFPLLLLLLGTIILPANAFESADCSADFEQFVSRQHFPAELANPSSGSEEDEHTFRPNCTVPICEGSLAPIFCTGSLISSAWYFGVQGQCPGSKLLNEPKVVMNNFKRSFWEQNC